MKIGREEVRYERKGERVVGKEENEGGREAFEEELS